MMAAELSIVISLAALAFLLFLYRDFQIDKLRDDLFALRDELFDYACQHDLLQHPGYTKLRVIMNSMIRFAHKVTLWRLALSVSFSRALPPEERPDPYRDWQKDLQILPPFHQQNLANFHVKMAVLILKSMIYRSPTLLAWGLVLRARSALRKVGESTTSALMQRLPGFQLLEAQASLWWQ
jgi:hypothetical protein